MRGIKEKAAGGGDGRLKGTADQVITDAQACNCFNNALPLPGYYYDLDESYDESDEEEVKAHLRRVTEQPPLKLDTSSEVRKHTQSHMHSSQVLSFLGVFFPFCLIDLSPKKVDFLRVCGLTTLTHRDDLLAQKRRKRRRMMKERSVSPPAVQGKKKACSSSTSSTPTTPLTTPYSAEQMDCTPELEKKKDFLLMFNLSHVSPQQRRGNNLFGIHTHILRATLLSSELLW